MDISNAIHAWICALIPPASARHSPHFISVYQSSTSLKIPVTAAMRELPHLPLSATSGVEHQPVNRAVWYASPLLRPNCRCNTQICPTFPQFLWIPTYTTMKSPFHTQDGYLHGSHHREQTSSFKSSHANVWHLIQTLHGERTRYNRFWFLSCPWISSSFAFNIYELKRQGTLEKKRGWTGSLLFRIDLVNHVCTNQLN